jgi:hypothetical protein
MTNKRERTITNTSYKHGHALETEFLWSESEKQERERAAVEIGSREEIEREFPLSEHDKQERERTINSTSYKTSKQEREIRVTVSLERER